MLMSPTFSVNRRKYFWCTRGENNWLWRSFFGLAQCSPVSGLQGMLYQAENRGHLHKSKGQAGSASSYCILSAKEVWWLWKQRKGRFVVKSSAKGLKQHFLCHVLVENSCSESINIHGWNLENRGTVFEEYRIMIHLACVRHFGQKWWLKKRNESTKICSGNVSKWYEQHFLKCTTFL